MDKRVYNQNNTMDKIAWTNVSIKLGELKPWDDNPRLFTKKQAKRLLESWEKFGQVQTIAIDPGGSVLDGHQRLSALLTLRGSDYQVDARQASRELTESERKELVITLHAGAVGSWDWDVLSGWDGAEIIDYGMDLDVLRDWKKDISGLNLLLESEKPEIIDAEPQIDRAAELQEKWGVKTGDLWKIGEHKLLCGDCTSKENAVILFGEKNPILGVTSPPYAVGKEYEEGISFQDHIKLLENLADRVLDIIIPGGFFFVNFGEIAALSHASPMTGSLSLKE